MKKLAFLAAAAAALYAAPASATLLLPSTQVPTSPGTETGTLLASLAVPGTALTFSGTLYAAVYRQPNGMLDFVYQVARTGPGSATTANNQPIDFLTASAFDTFTVDALLDGVGGFGPFVFATNGPDTSLVSRSASGDVLTVSFGVNDLVGTDISAVYIFRTNATNFGLGTYGILDGSSIQGVAFAPTSAVPEPGTWMMMLVGFGLVGGAMRFRRRSPRTARSPTTSGSSRSA